MIDYKKHIANLINVSLSKDELANLITPAADDNFGDYAFPCFRLAKEMRMSPVMIAQKLASEIVCDDVVTKVEAVNGYLNFFVNRNAMVQEFPRGQVRQQ